MMKGENGDDDGAKATSGMKYKMWVDPIQDDLNRIIASFNPHLVPNSFPDTHRGEPFNNNQPLFDGLASLTSLTVRCTKCKSGRGL